MNGVTGLPDDDLAEARELVAIGSFNEALNILRNKVRAKISESTMTMGRTPVLRFEAADPVQETLEQLFALCAWESPVQNPEDTTRLANDAQLLDECIMKTSIRGEIPFAVAAVWISLKCRPGASKDELNDAQQLIDRYLRQAALAADARTLEVTESIQSKYVFLVELLTCRVLPSLGLLESATSFLAPENNRRDLLRENDRTRLLTILQPILKETKPQSSAQPTTVEETSSTSPVDSAPHTSSPQPILDPKQLVEEFENRRRIQEAEQAKLAMLAGGAFTTALVLALLISERKRISGLLSNLGNTLFGE